MTLLKRILLTVAFPVGLLFSLAYALEDIRDAVCDYVPQAFFPPFGLLAFFAVGASIGLLGAFLVVPEAVLNRPANRDDLRRLLGVSGAVRVRAVSAASLAFILFGVYLIYVKAYV